MEEIPDFDSFDFGGFDPNGNFGVAIAGVPALGGISGPNDISDWFRVTLTAGNQYEIQLRGASTSDGTLSDPYFLGIYDNLGRFIESTSRNDGGSGRTANCCSLRLTRAHIISLPLMQQPSPTFQTWGSEALTPLSSLT